MKLKNGFVLSEIGGQTVVIPAGDVVDLKVMITLNETAKFVWTRLEQETDIETLVRELISAYDVDEATARKHVNEFVQILSNHGFLA